MVVYTFLSILCPGITSDHAWHLLQGIIAKSWDNSRISRPLVTVDGIDEQIASIDGLNLDDFVAEDSGALLFGALGIGDLESAKRDKSSCSQPSTFGILHYVQCGEAAHRLTVNPATSEISSK